MDNFFIHPKRYRLFLKNSDDLPEVAGKRLGDGLRWIYRLAKVYLHGQGLDVGAAFFKNQYGGWPGAVPVDLSIPGSGSATKLIQADASQDYVFSSHCWEHVADPEAAAREAWRVLKPGGLLFLYLPFPGHPPWDPALNPDCRGEHKWQPDPSSVSRLLLLNRFELVYVEHEKDELTSFVVIGRKL